MTTMTTLTLPGWTGAAPSGTFDTIEVPITGDNYRINEGLAVFPTFGVMIDAEDQPLTVNLALYMPDLDGDLIRPPDRRIHDADGYEMDLGLSPADVRELADRMDGPAFRFPSWGMYGAWSFRGPSSFDPDSEVRVAPFGIDETGGGASLLMVNHTHRLVLGVVLNGVDRRRLVTALRRAVDFTEGR